MSAEVHERQEPLTRNALFEVHMLLLRWGRERLARQKESAEDDNGLVALASSAERKSTKEVVAPSLSP